eukprot:CAMPEP_0174734280 /NCGR_PEP_ID=MMETSP1094-20130205/62990_1 /TAXON_ID=156173 /ORGANISM="Chrysochromulina brevifilum, Strain UTEX LB 985" /LENGTH=146 /DNA_ID=CAMNT_0015937073 /DNA_START=198 /DNA_END=638 /DNA_ORIENTATION=+
MSASTDSILPGWLGACLMGVACLMTAGFMTASRSASALVAAAVTDTLLVCLEGMEEASLPPWAPLPVALAGMLSVGELAVSVVLAEKGKPPVAPFGTVARGAATMLVFTPGTTAGGRFEPRSAVCCSSVLMVAVAAVAVAVAAGLA